jgi:phosphatidate cytidylyltransferase
VRGYYESIPEELRWVFIGIFGIILLAYLIIYLFHRSFTSDLTYELLGGTKMWWYIALGLLVLTTLPPIWGTLIVGFISYTALRDMLSISPLRASDRLAFLLCYLAVPVQYYFAHIGFYNAFVVFIPIFMFIIIPSILVLSKTTKGIGRSMSIIPAILLLTVFMPSHANMILHLDFPNYEEGGAGLLVFAIVLVAFNDIFQYAWGRILGYKQLLPSVIPNKTLEGFILGTLSTGALAYGLKFITPLSGLQSVLIGIVIGLCGFMGDAILAAIKRDARLRDTGESKIQDGSTMDRLDSLIVALPVYFHIMRYLSQQL